MKNEFISEINEIDERNIKLMNYLHEYLENNWQICKKRNCFIVKNQNNKIYLSSSYNLNNSNNIRNRLISTFLYHVLNRGWTIKKKGELYILFKKHEGKKEYFSEKFLSTFIKEILSQ